MAQGVPFTSHPSSHLRRLPGQVQTNAKEKAIEKKNPPNKKLNLLTDYLKDSSFSLQELIHFIATVPTRWVKTQLETSGSCFGVWLYGQG